MKTTTRRGSWRKAAPGQYVKNIGTYGNIKYGATARVSFVPFPTCEIIDATGAHVAIPTPADAKKFITAAKKVYTKDTKADEARLQKRGAAGTGATKPTTTKKWHQGMVHTIGFGWTEQPSAYERQTSGHTGKHLARRQESEDKVHGSIRTLEFDAKKMDYIASIPGAKTTLYKKRAASVRARIKKLRG